MQIASAGDPFWSGCAPVPAGPRYLKSGDKKAKSQTLPSKCSPSWKIKPQWKCRHQGHQVAKGADYCRTGVRMRCTSFKSMCKPSMIKKSTIDSCAAVSSAGGKSSGKRWSWQLGVRPDAEGPSRIPAQQSPSAGGFSPTALHKGQYDNNHHLDQEEAKRLCQRTSPIKHGVGHGRPRSARTSEAVVAHQF